MGALRKKRNNEGEEKKSGKRNQKELSVDMLKALKLGNKRKIRNQKVGGRSKKKTQSA